MNSPHPALTLLMAAALSLLSSATAAERWTPEKAQSWMNDRPWPVGGNYLPASAVNQLEMWQADTFDPAQIDREFGWAEDLGFNSMRVFLHDLAWKEDPEGFLGRMEKFLQVADRHHIEIIFVIFDGCWNPHPHAGLQPAPTPGVHNSQWVQSPGVDILSDPTRRTALRPYVEAVLTRFRQDRRILAWDLFNEPDNGNARSYPKEESPNKAALSLALLQDTFAWARKVDPIQPLTVAIWGRDWDWNSETPPPVAAFSLEHSDIISFHCYEPLEGMKKRVAAVAKGHRPLLCSEYMARPIGSTFESILPYLKREGIGAINWGFVSGKSQTRYAWDTWAKPETSASSEWFHDVLRPDGSPYRPAEVRFLHRLLRDVPCAFGWMPDGRPVQRYTLANGRGLVCRVITYGGIITELRTPDRGGASGDVVLGYDNFAGYLQKGTPYFGALIGRVANRIAAGRFTLDGKDYVLATNNGPNHLHGGIRGFDKVIWQARCREEKGEPALELRYTSRDGEEGYPGKVEAMVTYRLSERDELRIDYEATTDRDTPVNLTNHSYWNLAGGGNILGAIATLHASHYTPVDATLIPTGEIAPVRGTPMDFTAPKAIGRDLGQLTGDPRGYDHNFVLDRSGKGLTLAAEVFEPSSGRVIEVLTDQPGIQFYTGNFLDGTVRGKGGARYQQYDAFCLETQHFPDAVHHANFPSIILHPGETYRTATIFRFSVRH